MKVKGGSLKFGKSGVWSWTVNAIIHTFLAALWWRSTSWVISRSSKGRKVTATQRFSPGALRGYGIPVTDPSKSDRWCWRAMGTCLRAKRTHWRDALARGACHMIVIPVPLDRLSYQDVVGIGRKLPSHVMSYVQAFLDLRYFACPDLVLLSVFAVGSLIDRHVYSNCAATLVLALYDIFYSP